MESPFETLFDVDNPGTRTEAVKAAMKEKGVARYHFTVMKGADPKKVEREVLRSLEALEAGAFFSVWPKPSLWVRLGEYYRVWKFNFRMWYRDKFGE